MGKHKPNNYKYVAPKTEDTNIEPVVEDVVEKVEGAIVEVEPQVEESKLGIVFDCAKLRVREHANTDAKIICEIAEGSEVMIDEKESTEDFYKICTEAGVEGFCMKKFITVKQ